MFVRANQSAFSPKNAATRAHSGCTRRPCTPSQTLSTAQYPWQASSTRTTIPVHYPGIARSSRITTLVATPHTTASGGVAHRARCAGGEDAGDDPPAGREDDPVGGGPAARGAATSHLAPARGRGDRLPRRGERRVEGLPLEAPVVVLAVQLEDLSERQPRRLLDARVELDELRA